MSHIYHPDLGDPARPAILVDGCDDCEAAGKNPVQRLDKDFIRALWQKMVEVEHGAGAGHYRSHAEAEGCHRLQTVAAFLERYTGVDPWTLFREPVPA